MAQNKENGKLPPRTGSLSTLQPVAIEQIDLVDLLAATRIATLLPAINYAPWQWLDQVSINTGPTPKIEEMNPAGSMEARRAKLAANSSNFQEVSHTSLTVIVQRLTIDSSLASAWSFQIFLGTQCLKNDRSSDQLISSCWGIDSVTTRRIPSQVMPQCHCLAIHVHTFFKIFCFFPSSGSKGKYFKKSGKHNRPIYGIPYIQEMTYRYL